MENFIYEPIYIDNNYIVLNKNHMVYVIPDRNNTVTPLIDILRNDYGSNVLVCHRLDAGTSGVMVFARNKKSHQYLSQLFEKNLVIKHYAAVTTSHIYNQTLMLPIAKSNHGKYNINFKSGKKAVTSFFLVDSNKFGALVTARLYTGRTHQIRVHLKALKSPLYYDFLYNKKIDDKRLSLQCISLGFYDKFSGKNLYFSSKLSFFMENTIKRLELSYKNVYQYVYDS